MKIVYLFGPINGRSDADCNDWRSKAKSLLEDLQTLDPMRHDYRGDEEARYLEIIENDKADIDASDALLVYFDKPSFGTAMEIYYAADQGKRVVAVNASGNPTYSEHDFGYIPAHYCTQYLLHTISSTKSTGTT